MTEPLTIPVRQIARSLRISIRQVEAVWQLLEEGKTAPFIARYRKEQTDGLEEDQIRRIRRTLSEARLLAQRKEAILRTIQLQGKLTPELETQIRTATTARRVEDLYLPYKPKKEGLAAVARGRGLEQLAEEILQAAPSCANLEARAADFVNPDKQVRTPADALLGAGHILAEMISEHADLRKKLREVFYKTGRICSQRVESIPFPPGGEAKKSTTSSAEGKLAPTQKSDLPDSSADGSPICSGETSPPMDAIGQDVGSVQPSGRDGTDSAGLASDGSGLPPETGQSGSIPAVSASAGENQTGLNPPEEVQKVSDGSGAAASSEPQDQPPLANSSDNSSIGLNSDRPAQVPPVGTDPENRSGELSDPVQNPSESQGVVETGFVEASPQAGDSSMEKMEASNPPPSQTRESYRADASLTTETLSGEKSQEGETAAEAKPLPAEGQPRCCSEEVGESTASASGSCSAMVSGLQPEAASVAAKPLTPAEIRRQQKELKKQREMERRLREYSDLFDFQEPIRKISAHRILTLNRAERQKMVRVWIQCDLEAMKEVLYQECVPPDHPHADFLRGCAEDSLRRLIIPSLEREARRELTEKAEAHAVEVFGKSLRKMLLQRPVRGQRILAVDPGLRNGCVLAALDEFGNVLEHGKVYLVGRSPRRQEARQKILQTIRRYRIGLVVIGNGAGSRIFEDFLAEIIDTELKTEDIRYGIVSETGTSV